MSSDKLLNFGGNDLRVIEQPVRISDERMRVILAGRQSNELLHHLNNYIEGTRIVVRRLLASNGITLKANDMDVEGRTLTMEAMLTQPANSETDMLSLIEREAFIARPYHFHRRTPVTADMFRYSVMQQFARLNNENLDLLNAADEEETRLQVRAHIGSLLYYQESANPKEWLRTRLKMQPGEIDEHSRPVWAPHQSTLLRPHTHTGILMNGFNAPFHAALFHALDADHDRIIESPNGNAVVFDRNPEESPVPYKTVTVELYDRRPKTNLRPYKEFERAKNILTASYDASRKFFHRLAELSSHDQTKRIAALVTNRQGVNSINITNDSPWVKTTTSRQSQHSHQPHLQLMSSLAPDDNPLAYSGRGSAEYQLIEQAQRHGMDGGGILVSETFPEHASLDALVAADVTYQRKPFNSLMFRYASRNHGPYISGHDVSSLHNLLDNGVSVFWSNDDIHPRQREKNLKGELLQLVRLNHQHKAHQGSIAFIPRDRVKEYERGTHIAFYGTARTLSPQYLAFMDELFELLEKEQSEEQPIVVHSGGGPDTSTMGVANMHAQQHGMLSIGHVLGVKKEPTTRYLDGIMPFRNADRDVRQGNMAKAGDIFICLEGGGGTREERGIAQTDLAIAREKPFPMILVGTKFYANEYEQYLTEVENGTLDDSVLACISLVENAEDAACVIRHYRETGTVLRSIPLQYEARYAEAAESFRKVKKLRQQAWQLEEEVTGTIPPSEAR